MKKNKFLKFVIIASILITIFILLAPILFTKISWINLGVDNANEIGDTLGGIMGPFVGLLAAFLTFLAFWVQYQANQKVQEQFKKQEISSKLYHYHDLLNKSREKFQNIEFDINALRYKSFDAIILKFKIILNQIIEIDYFFYNLENFKVLKNSYFEINNSDIEYKIQSRIHLIIKVAWKITFEGILDKRYYSENFVINIHNLLKYNVLSDNNLINTEYTLSYYLFEKVGSDIGENLNLPSNLIIDHLKNTVYNSSFNSIDISGHFNTLSPYFQLYFQAIKLLNESDILDYNEKYEFAKMFRAEMTKDEIYVYFINSLSEYGHEWELKIRGDKNDIRKMDEKSANKCLITKYNILKHISDVPEIYINVKELYPDLIFSSDTDSERDVKKAYRSSIFE